MLYYVLYLLRIYYVFYEDWKLNLKKFWIILFLFHVHNLKFFCDLYCNTFIWSSNFDGYQLVILKKMTHGITNAFEFKCDLVEICVTEAIVWFSLWTLSDT